MKPVALIVLDGFGKGEDTPSNPVVRAHMPHIKGYLKDYPNTLLAASEQAVGLQKGQMGSSEVGHLTMGAGRIVLQTPARIHKAIKTGEFHKNPALLNILEKVNGNKSTLHLLGLMSESGVHAFMHHAFEVLAVAKKIGIKDVCLHWIGDGRDSPPASGKHFLTLCEKRLKLLRIGRIATMVGRYYAMDRDTRWERTQKAYDAIVRAKGALVSDARKALEASYEKGITDEFLEPTIMQGYEGIQEDDALIFFNFRADRARQLTKALVEKKFDAFPRERDVPHFVAMTQYYPELKAPVLFSPETYSNILPEVLSKNRCTQLHAAETEKYAHVTFFFNGGQEKTFAGEDRILVPSPKVATYDLKPEMSAFELTQAVERRLHTGHYDFTLVNFANPDMVGHTGKMGPTVKALEAVDTCVGKLVDAILEQDGAVLLTADHGNCEMISDTGVPHTSHTLNKVPCILIVPKKNALRNIKLRDGSLANIAPTILELMGLPKPKEMDAASLLMT
jgi:2,3-bisphosphoglycerate-independent phosphoglycerate mutase